MFPAGENEDGPMATIRDIASEDIRSEGMSYGMMIAIHLDRQDDFDAMWNWSFNVMRNGDPAHPAYRYYAWQVGFDDAIIDPMPAPDGEEYFAMALLLADGRWGSREGLYDYRTQALELLDAMKNREQIDNGVALFNAAEAQVRFTPNTFNFSTNGDHTDPSYHLPAFYMQWAEHGTAEDAEFWLEAADVSRAFFAATTHPQTGLNPDYANFDGSPKAASWDEGTANFRYDAWRTVMNIAVDWSWYEADPVEVDIAERLQVFFADQGIGYGNVYTLDGQRLEPGPSTGLIAMNATAGLAAQHELARDFTQALWDAGTPTGMYRDYDGMLYMLGMLHCAGRFRVY